MKLAVVIWMLFCAFFIAMGVFSMKAKKPVGFWANTEKPKNIKDVKKYNQAMGKLWFTYAILLFLFGLPLAFCEQNSPVVFLTVVGTAFSTIFLMVFYVLRIESKYVMK